MLRSVPEQPKFRFDSTRGLAEVLCHALISDTGLNQNLEHTAPAVAGALGASRLCLVDFNEHTERFNLLFFAGYPSDARHALQRRMADMELERAQREHTPYFSGSSPRFLVIPCVIRDILEAALVVEWDIGPELSDQHREAAELASRFFGLFMSSTRLEVNRDRMLDTYDLHRARQIQLKFLPEEMPQWNGCELLGVNRASKVVGGDYYDYFRTAGDELRCILADACGHGMAAALIMSNFRGLLQSELVRRRDPAELFELLNGRIYTDDELVQYLTGVLLCYSPATRRLEYVNAGHFDPLVIDAAGEIRSLPGGGPPLGMFRTATYPLGTCSLHSGDLVVLFSDGLVDIRNSVGEYLGVETLSGILARNRNDPLSEIAAAVMDQARDFSGGAEPEDDVTLFLLRVT